MNEGTRRENIKSGLKVKIVLKADQRSGKLTEGIVKDLLTNSSVHPHGIKVRLQDGQVGRVQEIIE
ncbi:YwbE family protein [Marinifilum sp. RC60d5]|uniref:YwbE family protein n=1 Tax=Marinifilum sp. RC60d5 TaxID=3458414 RepID=UPI0040358C77